MRNIILILITSLALSDSYKEPKYTLIDKNGNIEIRQYSENIIAKTSISDGDDQMNNSMFRTLAGYIFGGNDKQQSIPMTTPVITSKKENSYSMIFFMLDVKDKKDLPSPNSSNVKIETINLGKVITIEFAWWANENNVRKYKKKLDKYIKDNDLEVVSDMMIAQYNPPLSWPLSRRNELIFQIK